MLSWLLKSDEKTIRIADNTNQYNFYVKHEPEFLDTSTNLNLIVYTSKKMVATVPCAFRWYRIRNGLTTQATQFKGSSFLCQPSDAGCIIQAQIIGKDNSHSGTAIIQFGPVKLDMVLRKEIEGALKSNSKIFISRIIQDKTQRQCQLRIFSDKIKILLQSHCLTFQYSIEQPRFQTLAKDPLRINITFTVSHQQQTKRFLQSIFQSKNKFQNKHTKIVEPKIELKFPTRAQRDIFMYVIKAFYTQRQIKNSMIINQIQKLGFENEESFNYLMEISTLKQDILNLSAQNKQLKQQKYRYQSQIQRLKQQLKDTFQLYTKLNSQNKKIIVSDQTQNGSFFKQKSLQLNTSANKLAQTTPNYTGNNKLKAMLEQVDDMRVCFRNYKENNRITLQNLRMPEKKQTNIEIVSLLDKLDQSCYGREQFQNQKTVWQLKIKNITIQKTQIQKQLEEAKKIILQLRQKIAQKNKADRHGIKFTYQTQKIKINPQDSQNSILNSSAIEECQWQKQRNQILIELNQKLRKQNESQKQLIKSFQRQRQFMKDQISQVNNQSFILKEQTCQNYQKLKIQNEHLNQTISKMKSQENIKTESKYKKKIQELQRQIEIYKRNQDAFNRSQHISLEMDNYNQEQLKIFKEQNQILTAENQKLVKFCQKYKSEAKECGKLRQQLMLLKAKSNARFFEGFDKSINISKEMQF